nr:DUF2079 domain-containing protein [uncultured Actinomyces sp.]
MRFPVRSGVARAVSAWWLPAVIACAVAALYISFSLAQWRTLSDPSWDLAIFTEAAQAYSRFEAPIVPIKGPGYNLLGDHFHPILILLGPIFRFFPSAFTLLIVQDLLIAASVLPIARLAQRFLGRGGAVLVGLAYGLGWGLQGAVAAQFHEVCVAVPLLACAGAAFVERRWGACMAWLAPIILVKEDLGLTVFVAGLALAWRRRGEDRSGMLASLAYALFGILAFVVTVKLFLPAMNPAGTWAYSLDGSATGAGTAMAGATAAREVPSLWQILAVPSVKIVTLAVLLAGAGVVGARSPWFALVLPTLAWRFAGSVDAYYQWSSWHYNAVLVPIAACALLDVIAGWLAPADAPVGLAAAVETDADCANPAPASSGRRRALAWAAACVPAISLALTATSLPLWKLPTLTDSPRLDAAQGAIDAVPVGASVETDTTLLARLVPGRDVYWVGTTVGMDAPPEYVVVDRQSYAWGGAEVDAESWASAAHPGHTYETIYSAQGFRVARRTS